MAKFKITDHVLVPKHTTCSNKEKEEIYKKFNIEQKQMPKILKNDPAIRDLNVKAGDIIKIIRESPTAEISIFYRVVISE